MFAPTKGIIEFRVRYPECDPMSLAHHAAYPVWFEMGRTELLREAGFRYRDLEQAGAFFAVYTLNIKYRRPARYDDPLRLETTLVRWTRAKLEHEYALYRGSELLTTAATTIACLDADGRPRAIPDHILPESP